MDIRQELLAMKENDLIEERDEEEIEREGFQLLRGQSKNDIHEGIRRWDKKEAVKMVQFMLSDRGHKWEE